MQAAGRLGLALPQLVDASTEDTVTANTFQPPRDTVDDVEPLCSVCGGPCDGNHSGAGDVATAPVNRSTGSGSVAHGGASFSEAR